MASPAWFQHWDCEKFCGRKIPGIEGVADGLPSVAKLSLSNIASWRNPAWLLGSIWEQAVDNPIHRGMLQVHEPMGGTAAKKDEGWEIWPWLFLSHTSRKNWHIFDCPTMPNALHHNLCGNQQQFDSLLRRFIVSSLAVDDGNCRQTQLNSWTFLWVIGSPFGKMWSSWNLSPWSSKLLLFFRMSLWAPWDVPSKCSSRGWIFPVPSVSCPLFSPTSLLFAEPILASWNFS